MKRFIGLLTAVTLMVLALSLSLVTAVPVAADTINVSSGGDIQAAIDAATDGDIINVAAGTCTGNIDVNKRVILQASGTVTVNPASASDHIFHVTANNVTIDGFTLVGDSLDPESTGLLLYGVTGCTISNNNWSSTANATAICLDGADSNIIQSNTCAFTVTTSGTGINLQTSDSNIVKDNTCIGGEQNIWIDGSSNNTIQGNTCSGSNHWGIRLESNSEASTGNTIKGNTCSENVVGIRILAGSGNNSISDTTVSGNTLTGNTSAIQLIAGEGVALTGITITQNTCQSNTYAIRIWEVYAGSGSNITISNNDISSNTVGISFEDWGDATLVTASPDNSIVNNTSYGVRSLGTGELNAQGNWWGTTDASQIEAMIDGEVSYTGYLTTAPAAVGLTVDPDILPTVATSTAGAVGFDAAMLIGNLTDMGTATQVDVWFEWGTTDSYGQTTPFETKTTAGTFSASLSGLTEDTEYHFKAVARSADGTTTGSDVTFHTLDSLAVTTQVATSIDLYSATLNGDLTDLGGATSVVPGFEWGTQSGNLTAGATFPEMSTTGTFSVDLTELIHNTTYYFRAKAVGNSTVYGAELSFTTVEEIIGISVSPTSIDFGSILAGESSDAKTVTVTNEGNIVENFTTTLSGTDADFYTDNLAIDSVAVTAWSATGIAIDATATPGLVLSMPIGANTGAKTATLVFWAEVAGP